MAQRFKGKSTETFNQESRAEFIRSLKPGDKVFVCMRNGDLVTTGEVSTYSTTRVIWIHRNGQLVSFSRKTGKERGRDLFLEVYDAGEYEEYCEKANQEIATWCEEEERKQHEQVKTTMNKQLESTDTVTLPGTIVTIRATEAAAQVAQICHSLRTGTERVYFVRGLKNLANEWLAERCVRGETVKETPIEDSGLSMYEPYWKPLETSEED